MKVGDCLVIPIVMEDLLCGNINILLPCWEGIIYLNFKLFHTVKTNENLQNGLQKLYLEINKVIQLVFN